MKKLLCLMLAGTILLSTAFITPANEKNNYKKMDLLIEKMMTDSDPTDGSHWNQEGTTRFKWSYINGCMASAIMDLYSITGEEKYKDFADTYMSPFITDTYDKTSGYINPDTGFKYKNYTLDDINSGKALIKLVANNSENSEKYTKALTQTLYTDMLEYMLENQTTGEGNLWHKKVYPYQVWLDGIYMETPFWLDYELNISQDKDKFQQAAANVTNQIETVYAKLRDENTGLYYHGYDAQADTESKSYNKKSAMSWAETGTGHSKSFWLRGTGWYAMALIDNIELLQQAEKVFNTDNSQYINSISQIYTDLMDSVLKYQDENTKLWYQVIDKPYDDNYNYIETSGSAALSYALMKGYNCGITDISYYNKGLEVFNSLCENKIAYTNSSENEVNITDICCTAGLAGPSSGTTSGTAIIGPKYTKRDGTYKYYVSEMTVNNDAKGVAPMIFAYCQVLKFNSAPNIEETTTEATTEITTQATTQTTVETTTQSTTEATTQTTTETTTQTTSEATTEATTLLYGDADCNGQLSAGDSVFVLQKVLNNTFVMNIEEYADYIKWIDVNCNNKIDADDAAQILQKVLCTSFKMKCEL